MTLEFTVTLINRMSHTVCRFSTITTQLTLNDIYRTLNAMLMTYVQPPVPVGGWNSTA